jgi:hypothetical protein
MDIIRKDATITNTDDAGPGSFEVILSAPTLDRDGDTLKSDEWKTPLPDHITFDIDHGMNVASTVGSGVPRIDEETGNLVVSGSYSSLPRAQEVRTLVNEGHIRTTSVAFMTEKTKKDGKEATVRELLNGAFVAVPSNREALVLASKDLKAGARNSASDAEHIQAIHDHALALGAVPGKSFTAAATKDPDIEDASDPGALAQAVDAAIDEAIDLLAGVDASTLPAEVQQAIALIQAADAAVDELLDALGVQDPDEDAAANPVDASAAAPAKAAAPAETTAADADPLSLRARSLAALAAGYTSVGD